MWISKFGNRLKKHYIAYKYNTMIKHKNNEQPIIGQELADFLEKIWSQQYEDFDLNQQQ